MGTPGMSILFSKARNYNDVGDRLVRLTNLTTPNMILGREERRSDSRANRALPVVLAVWEDGKPVASDAITAITKDLGCTGLSVILRQPIRANQLVVVFWVPNEPGNPHLGEPLYVLVNVVANTPIGGGFWQCGLDVQEMLLLSTYPELASLDRLVKRLPPTPQAEQNT